MLSVFSNEHGFLGLAQFSQNLCCLTLQRCYEFGFHNVILFYHFRVGKKFVQITLLLRLRSAAPGLWIRWRSHPQIRCRGALPLKRLLCVDCNFLIIIRLF